MSNTSCLFLIPGAKTIDKISPMSEHFDKYNSSSTTGGSARICVAAHLLIKYIYLCLCTLSTLDDVIESELYFTFLIIT